MEVVRRVDLRRAIPQYSSCCYRFSPSVFLYLASVVPSIWLIELDKLDSRLQKKNEINSMAQNEHLATVTSTTTQPNNGSLLEAVAASMTPPSRETKTGSPTPAVDLDVLKDAGVRSPRIACSLIRRQLQLSISFADTY